MAGTDFDVRVNLEANGAQVQLRQMEQGLQGVERAASQTGRGFNLLESAATGFMTALSGAAINAVSTAFRGLGMAVAGSVQTFMGFESSMNNVAALTGAVGKEFDALEKKARELGASTRYSASEVADAMGFLGMAGFETNEILSSTQTMLDLAAAGQLELAEAADIASNVMGQFGVSAENADRVTNVLAATAASANTNVSQLAEAMNYLGPTANSLGITLEETAAIIGVLGDSGIQGSAAGRALGTSLVRLADDSNAKVQTAIKELGLEVFDLNGEFVGMAKFLEQLETGLDSYNDEQKAATLTTLLGADAFQEINILLERGSEAYAEYTDSITGTNRAQEIAEIQSDGLGGTLKELSSATEELAITTGEALAPALNAAAEKASEVILQMVGQETASNNLESASQTLAEAIDNINAEQLANDIANAAEAGVNFITVLGGIVGGLKDFNDFVLRGIPGLSQLTTLMGAFYDRSIGDSTAARRLRLGLPASGMASDIGRSALGLPSSVESFGRNLLAAPSAAIPQQSSAPPGTRVLPPPPSGTGSAPTGTRALPPPPGSPSTTSLNSAAQQASSKAKALADAARQLGVTPLELAAIIDLESSFNPAADNKYYSHENGPHWGLWQAGKAERAWAINQLGLPSGTDWRQVPFETQMSILPAWAASRGYRPDMGQAQLYSTILAGSPGNLNTPDKNKTTVENAEIGPGQRHWKAAEKWLSSQNYTGGSNEYLAALTQSLFNEEPLLTNPMGVGIGADPLGAKQMMFDVNRQAILESYNATNEAIAQQSALMERRLELASEDAMTRKHILELEERDRDVKEGLAELEKSLQAEYKAGNLLQEDIQQQLDERIVAETRLTAAMLDRQEAERKEAELQELNARLYEQAQERMARINEQQAQAKEYADRLTDGFTNLAIGVVSGAASMEQALGQLFNTILSYLANQAFQSLFGQLFGGLFGVSGGGVASTGRDIASGFLSGGALGFANGGVISGGFRAFADGGVVNRPTLGLIGEGSMNEAVVPLPNGRAIPVEMRGGGTNITVNVNNPGTGEDGRRLGKQISEAIKAELVQQSRVGGLLRR